MSAAKIDVPSSACVVMTTRGFDFGEGIAKVVAVVEVLKDILEAFEGYFLYD